VLLEHHFHRRFRKDRLFRWDLLFPKGQPLHLHRASLDFLMAPLFRLDLRHRMWTCDTGWSGVTTNAG